MPCPRDDAPPASARVAPDRRTWRALLVAVAVTCLLVALPLLPGRLYTANDLGDLHIPFRLFQKQCLERGHSPLWMPSLTCGLYLQGEGQAALCHPVQWILLRFLPFTAAFDSLFLLSYLVALAGAFFMLRRWGLDRAACLFGAVLFAFSGYFTWHFMHLNVIAILAQLPWILLLVDVFLRGERRGRVALAFAGVSLLTASQLLLGHPQHVWFTLLAEIAYVLALGRPCWRARRLLWLAGALALGVVTAGVQLLPSYTAFRATDRPMTREYALTDPLMPVNLTQLVAPYTFGRGAATPAGAPHVHEFVLYNGALVLPLVLYLLTRRRRSGGLRGLILAALGLGAVSLWLALGRYGGLYLLQGYLPVVGKFRCACRYIALVHFAEAVLAACAVHLLQREATAPKAFSLRKEWWLCIAPALALLISLTALAWARGRPGGALAGQISPPAWLALGPILAVVAAALLALTLAGRRGALLLLLVGGVAEVATVNAAHVAVSPTMTLAEMRRPAFPPPTSGLRVMNVNPGENRSNRLTVQGFRLLGGVVGIPPARTLFHANPRARQIAGVAVRFRIEGDAVRPEPAQLPPLPRARLLSRAFATGDINGDLCRVDPARVALVGRDLALTPGPPGRVEITRDEPGRITLATYAPAPRLLVVSERHDPRWVATRDGRPVEVLPVYADFIGCVVPEGEHTIRFRFEPVDFTVGLRLTLCGLALTAAGALWLAYGRKPDGAGKPDPRM